MTRVTAWGIGRKNKMHEMCAAIRLLAHYDFESLSGSTAFVIRGQDVSLDEIRRYFRRKGYSDPVAYVKGLPTDQVIRDLDVRLREKKLRGRTNSSDSSPNPRNTPDTDSDDAPLPVANTTIEPVTDVAEIGTHLQGGSTADQEFSQALSFNSPPNTKILDGSPFSIASLDFQFSISTPCWNSDTLLLATQTYINMYTVSIRQHAHWEPKAHYQTLHGQFSFQIQEGVACKRNNDIATAMTAHRRAFGLIEGIVVEDHPMSITLILSLMCELLASGDMKLVKHIAKLIVHSYTKLGRRNHPVDALFRALLGIEHLGNHHLYCALRVASEYFDLVMSNSDWRSMYLKERLCDALYHSQEIEERVRTRRQLLQDQKSKYGPNARNVLFTQMNVAEDYASLYQPDQARALYTDALDRAESLLDDHGFSRGRVRFAALEGLGNLLMTEAQAEFGSQWNALMADTGILEQALSCYSSAEVEASRWFESSSKRSIRILQKKKEAEDKLHQAQQALDMSQYFVPASSSSWDVVSDPS